MKNTLQQYLDTIFNEQNILAMNWIIIVLTEYLIDFRNDEICSSSFNVGTGFFRMKNLNENGIMPIYYTSMRELKIKY